MYRRGYVTAVLLLTSLVSAYAQQTGASRTAPDCRSSQIAVQADDKEGNFNGMSHSGTALVVRNVSSEACRLQSFARLVFNDGQDKPLRVMVTPAQTAFRGPVSNGRPLPMGHGPVVVPIVLARGAEATADLRWVAGSVFDHSACVDFASIDVETGKGRSQLTKPGHICGPDADHLEVTATRFTLRTAAR